MFRIVKIKEKNRQNIIEQLKSDLLHNLFVIYDLLHEADETSMYVAYDTDNRACWHLLVYRGSTTLMGRLDGEKKPARELLGRLPSPKMILFCPPSLVNAVKEKIPHANCYPEYQMYVAKGGERLVTPNPAEKLEPKYASSLAELYSSSPEEFQFSRSEQKCSELLEKWNIYGIFEAERLVSAAVSVKRLPVAGEVIGVFTHPDYRRRGFGTMATSAATEDVLRHASGSNLYVGADNEPAIKLYEKLGYSKIDYWYWVDIGTGSGP